MAEDPEPDNGNNGNPDPGNDEMGEHMPENVADNLPAPNIEADDENPFLLQPDHPLFAPIQEKIRANLQVEVTKSQESLRELYKLKKVLQERQENAGVDLHGHQKQLSDAEQKIERLTQQYAETIAARTKIEQIQKQELQNLNDAMQAFETANTDEQQIRLQTQDAAQQLISVGAQNAELKSDAIIRKRTVSRAEEQIRQEEALKKEIELLIEQQQLNLKQYQDQEAHLMRQIQVQSEEKNQANEILQEAVRQMDEIQHEIDKTNTAWQDVLHRIELKTTTLKMELEKQIQELESNQISYNQSIKSGRQMKDKLISEIAQITNDTRVKQIQKKKLEDERKYLREEVIGRLQQLYQTLNADVNEKQIRLNQVNIEINKTTKQMDEISKLNDKASRLLNDLENNILVKNSEAIGDNRNLQGILALKRKVQTQITDARRAIDKAENETQKRLYDKVSCEAAVTTLRNAEDALRQEMGEKDKLISSYEQQIKKNANAIEQRSSAITRLNKKLEEYQKSHPESDNGPLQAMLSNLGKELQQASKAVKEAQNNWLGAQTDLVTYSQQYNDEIQEINDKTEQQQLLERKIRDLEFENNANQLKINAINRDIEFMHKDLQQISGRIADINGQIEKYSQYNFDNEILTQQQIDEKMEQINNIKQQIEAYNEEKQNMTASLIEVEEQIMLQQRKIQIQHQLMRSIEENCNLQKGGELAELEKEIHQYELRIRHMQKKQQEYLNKMKQGVDMRQIHSDNVRALVSIQKPVIAQTGAGLERELAAVRLRYEQTQQRLEMQKQQFQEVGRQLREVEQENEELAAVVQEYRRKLGGGTDGGVAAEAGDNELLEV